MFETASACLYGNKGRTFPQYSILSSTVMDFLKQHRLKMIGAGLSLVSMCMAVDSWVAFDAKNYGNALVFAAGALNLAILPFMRIKARMFRQAIGELADEALRNPPPLRFRLAMGLVWLLFLGGVACFFL